MKAKILVQLIEQIVERIGTEAHSNSKLEQKTLQIQF